MRLHAIRAVLLLAALTACGRKDGPTSPTQFHEVRGIVRSAATNEPLGEVNVSLVSGAGMGLAAKTASDGRYVISGVPGGESRIQFEKPGFVTQDWTLTIPASEQNVALAPVVAENPFETVIPTTTLAAGGAMVFPATPAVERGTLKFQLITSRSPIRKDLYLFAREEDARACALIPEGSRGSGSAFGPACTQFTGWTWGTMTGNPPDVRLSRSPAGIWWGVIKNTDPSQVAYAVSGKTVWVPD